MGEQLPKAPGRTKMAVVLQSVQNQVGFGRPAYGTKIPHLWQLIDDKVSGSGFKVPTE